LILIHPPDGADSFICGLAQKFERTQADAGSHAIRIEYFEWPGNEGITLGWKGPKMSDWEWLSESRANTGPQWPSIPIEPSADRAVIYRNFINGATPPLICGCAFNLTRQLAWKTRSIRQQTVAYPPNSIPPLGCPPHYFLVPARPDTFGRMTDAFRLKIAAPDESHPHLLDAAEL
jgi:hypothetical protein